MGQIMRWVAVKGQWVQVIAAAVGLASFLYVVGSFAHDWFWPAPPVSAIHIQCQPAMRRELAPDTRIYVANLVDAPESQVSGGLVQTRISSEAYEPQRYEFADHQKCVLGNYGTKPVAGVRFYLYVTFAKLRLPMDRHATKDNVITRTWPIFIEKVDAGPQSTFTFYIANLSELYADIGIAKDVTLEPFGRRAQFTVPLVERKSIFERGRMTLMPRSYKVER
jgi:hypothetical protein